MAKKLTFKNPTTVHNYAIEQGYDMGTSKLNTTLANKLKGIPKKDGHFHQDDIDNLLKYGKFKRLEGLQSSEISELDRKAKVADVRIKEAAAEKGEFANKVEKGAYFSKTEIESDQTARGKVLKDGVEGFGINMLVRVVETVGGDPALLPEVMELWTEEVENLFDRYSRPVEFEAPVFIDEEEVESGENI